jgi:hypothetical protein
MHKENNIVKNIFIASIDPTIPYSFGGRNLVYNGNKKKVAAIGKLFPIV